MRRRHAPAYATITAVSSLLLACSTPSPSGGKEPAAKLEIPGSIRTEHEAIHSELVEATKAPGEVGVAAKALAQVLHPHFVREEQIALPPLGLLARLAQGAPISDAEASTAMAMADSLRSELPGMLEEHTRIRAAVQSLRQAAVAAKAAGQQRLADDLSGHARTEEEVLYPAAILVGDLLRAKRGSAR